MDGLVSIDSTRYARLLVEFAPSMLAYWGADLRCRFANRAYELWFGVGPASLVGTHLKDLLGPELFALNEPHVRAALTGQEQTFERLIPGPNGIRRHGLAHYTPDIVDGAVLGFMVQVTDVTTLRATQLELERSNRSLRASHDALRLSEQRYQTLVSWLPVAIIVHREGRLVYVNRSAVRLFGAASECDLLGKPIVELIDPDLHELVQKRVGQAVNHGEPTSAAEVTLRKLDGSAVLAVIQATPITYDGQASLLSCLSDFTEHRKAQAELRQSQERLRGIVESASDAIISMDDAQIITDANAAAARMFRCAMHEMLGAPLAQFMPARFRDGHRLDVGDAGDGACHWRQPRRSRHMTGLRGDGEEFPIEVSISRLDLDGQPLYTAILRDITERQRIEAELRSGKATLEAALSSMSDSVLISDAQGQFVHFNHAFATFHRFASERDCLTALAEYPQLLDVYMANGEPVPLDQWAVPRALRGESATGVEYGMRRKDTGQTWMGSCNFAPIRAQDGAIVGAVVTGRDVTELKQRRVELETAHADLQRLITAQDDVQEAERKRIAQDLHDDLQQTLAAIRMDVNAIDAKLAADQDVAPILATVDKLVSEAITSTRRIVNDLQPQMLEDLGLVSALEVLAQQFSLRTGIACQVEAPDPAGGASARTSLPLVRVATSLYRIAQEALNNVIKHAQASAVHLRLTRCDDGMLVLRISDDGTGMRIGDRRKAQSFGLLGMQQRVRALGGALRIESQAGSGTVIEVLVPLPGMQALPPDAPSDPGPNTRWMPARSPAGGYPIDQASPVTSGAAGPATQEAIDALPGNIAVLDRQGVIQLVNRAWREFAEGHGDPCMIASGLGVNYLAVCRRSAQADGQAGHVLKGLLEVLQGRSDTFMAAYPCHSPHEQRWFLMMASPMASGHVQVTHLDVSHMADVVPQARVRAQTLTEAP